MSVDFQQLQRQIKAFGENAPARMRERKQLQNRAADLLRENANRQAELRATIMRVARENDPTLRCAVPAISDAQAHEALDGAYPAPPLPPQATILAADGSQINPDRHAQVNYCLVNVGAICMQLRSGDPPRITIQTELLFEDALYTAEGTLTDARIALRRDLGERKILFEQAAALTPPVITFTDGPMELWGSKDSDTATAFQESLAQYQQVLMNLHQLGVITAGYVDKPGANLVVRMLEIASMSQQERAEARKHFPLRGATDFQLFRQILNPGERSALFAIQSQSASSYADELALHFFYLNVGRPGHPWLARVEIPAWVASQPGGMDMLQAILIHQCQIMGSRPYPYLLQRAHEAALVTRQEREQITQMIVLELHRQGVDVGETSHKQVAKDANGRTRYTL